MTRKTTKKTTTKKRVWQETGEGNPFAFNSTRTANRYEGFPQPDGSLTLTVKNQFGQFLHQFKVTERKTLESLVDYIEEGYLIP